MTELPVALHLQRLEYQLQRVRAHCRRAIAEAWDSGRIAYSAADPLPFAAEVAALSGDGAGRAPDVLADARPNGVHRDQRPPDRCPPGAERLDDQQLEAGHLLVFSGGDHVADHACDLHQ